MVSFEALLFLGVLGSYLFDSSMLLYINELVFIKGYQKWHFISPGRNWLFRGRWLYIPNLFRPDRPLIRVYWPAPDQPIQNAQDILDKVTDMLIPIGYLVTTLLLILFLLLPVVLLRYGSGPQLLWVFGLIYFNISVILILVYNKKVELGISNKKYISLAIDSLACPPFALNIVRKIALHQTLHGDPIAYAQKRFDQETFQALIDTVKERVDEQLGIIEVDNPHYVELKIYKNKLCGMKQ